MSNYSIISARENVNNNKKWRIKRVIPKKLYLYYIRKKLPISWNEIEYLGEKGQEIVLPFTQEELETLEDNYKNKFLEKLIEKNKIEYFYVNPHLRKLLYKNEERLTPCYSSILLYIMFPQMFEQVLQDTKINKKDMKLVIIDSGNRKIEYILKLIVSELNYLTIITKRPEYFNEFVDIIYDNTGLLVEVMNDVDSQVIKGNVIIDLSNHHHKYYNSNMVVLDMESSLIKRQYLYSRKKNSRILYDLMFYSNNELVNNELLSFLLISNHQIVRDFLDDKNRESQNNGLTEIGRILNLKIAKLIYL